MTPFSETIAEMTPAEVLAAMHANSPLSRIHRVLAEGISEIEQADLQSDPPTPIERRRIELQIANRIAGLFGVELP